MHKYMKQMSI